MITLSRVGSKLFHKIKNRKVIVKCKNRCYHVILGIETSCDDTGCAILDEKGTIIAESLHTQNLTHLRYGGIIPDVARDLHQTHIDQIVSQTLQKANMPLEAISALAVTLKPGLPLSLIVGMKYAKYLSRRHNIPIIPIHHMEAHALVTRINHDISFPFLVLLISGGHCLLAVVQDINQFKLLGESIDLAPGEIFDKVARRMKLRNVPEYSEMCGGQAIELAAMKASNSNIFNLPLPLSEYKDCNFSFNGLKTSTILQLRKKERQHDVVADKLIPEVFDLSAALLKSVTKHLIHRTQRAMEYCRLRELIPENNKQLVVSGGVACNKYIFKCLEVLCNEYSYKIYRPPPKLCTDNGVMIAWNGMEKWKRGLDIETDVSKLNIEATSPLGESLISDVKKASIPVKLLKIKL